jgi:hypothetical protein
MTAERRPESTDGSLPTSIPDSVEAAPETVRLPAYLIPCLRSSLVLPYAPVRHANTVQRS